MLINYYKTPTSVGVWRLRHHGAIYVFMMIGLGRVPPAGGSDGTPPDTSKA
jgi:hypothetical protein